MCGTVLEVYVSWEIEIVPKDGFWLLLYYLIFHIENVSNIWTVSKNFEKYSPILFFEFFQNFEKYYFIQRFLNSIFNSWVIRYVSELFVSWNFFFFRRKDSAKVEFIAFWEPSLCFQRKNFRKKNVPIFPKNTIVYILSRETSYKKKNTH